jgi:hypothetical protein
MSVPSSRVSGHIVPNQQESISDRPPSSTENTVAVVWGHLVRAHNGVAQRLGDHPQPAGHGVGRIPAALSPEMRPLSPSSPIVSVTWENPNAGGASLTGHGVGRRPAAPPPEMSPPPSSPTVGVTRKDPNADKDERRPAEANISVTGNSKPDIPRLDLANFYRAPPPGASNERRPPTENRRFQRT